ncbi:MAG: hypothetical protein ACYTF9_13495 [Planctomycetota bacterium]|jgi:hypothetical protein
MSEPLPCPLPRSRVVDLYFLEHRAKLIDLAAFLDRLDRAEPDGNGEDFRVAAFRSALAILSDAEAGRAKRVLEHFSDHSTTPIDSAAGLKGAFGANPAGTGDGTEPGA